MATTLLVISAILFLVTNGIDSLIAREEKVNMGSPLYWQISDSKTEFLCKVTTIFSFVSLLIFLPTTISLAFHLNWFLALGIAILLKLILQGVIVSVYMVIFYRGNPYFSMILSFILGIVTMIIGLIIR